MYRFADSCPCGQDSRWSQPGRAGGHVASRTGPLPGSESLAWPSPSRRSGPGQAPDDQGPDVPQCRPVPAGPAVRLGSARPGAAGRVPPSPRRGRGRDSDALAVGRPSPDQTDLAGSLSSFPPCFFAHPPPAPSQPLLDHRMLAFRVAQRSILLFPCPCSCPCPPACPGPAPSGCCARRGRAPRRAKGRRRRRLPARPGRRPIVMVVPSPAGRRPQ